MSVLIPAIVFGFCLGILLCRAMMIVQVMDAPDGERKLQSQAVPSSGGVGIVIATALALTACVALFEAKAINVSLILPAGVALACIVGLIDDLAGMDARLKLGLLLAIAIAIAMSGIRVTEFDFGSRTFPLHPLIGVLGTALWFFVVMNAVNFMDGSNGMAMGCCAVIAIILTILAALDGQWDLVMLFSAVTAAIAGFLVWNLPGHLYAGDAGAFAVGLLLAAGAVVFIERAEASVWLPPLLFLPFLADVFMTLIWRARAGRRLLDAHREHIYQIGLRVGLTHLNIAAIYWIFTAHTGLAALGVYVVGGRAPQIAFFLGLFVFIWMFWRIRRAALQRGVLTL